MYGNVNYTGTLPQDFYDSKGIQAEIYGSQPTVNDPRMFTNTGQTDAVFNDKSWMMRRRIMMIKKIALKLVKIYYIVV